MHFTPLVLTFLLAAGQEPERPKLFENSVGMTLIPIPPGTFVMGEGERPPATREAWERRDWDESPAHRVTISKPFFIGKHEVTNAQYEQFDPDHKTLRGRRGASREDDEPVTYVTWQEAVNFCKWLSKKEGKFYRLPTEAEWEYACRAGTTTPFSTGETLSHAQANMGLAADGKKRLNTVLVGRYPPNPWGLHDMHGNVAEWCLDWFGPYEAGAQTDPLGRADGHARVTRGWSYLRVNLRAGAGRYCRSANRSGHLPDDANRCTGFRVVMGPMLETAALPPAPPPLHQRDVKQTPPPGKDDRPRFVNFVALKTAPTMPQDAWGPIFAKWNHFSAVCVCPNGDVLAAWYSTVSESGRECAQAASRLRAGSERWEPASFFFGVPDVNTHAPVLLSDGRHLYHFFTQSLAGWDDAADVMRISDDNGATWSKPRIILSRDHPMSMSQPCSAVVAPDGTLVLAVDGDRGHKDERVLISRDSGKSWTVGRGDIREAAGRYAIHPALVRRDDGTLLAFMRGPDPMPAFSSDDWGESWRPMGTPFPGISVGQKAAALKLSGGSLLLASFDKKKDLVGGGVFAALSLDDGRTWPHIRKVEGPTGYLSAAQAPDGMIYLFGSRLRCAAFNEAWLRQGGPIKKVEK